MAPLVKVSSLVVDYGTVRAVHGIDFEVEEGEFLTLLGPSGCGKTTTLRCIAGLERPVGGEIEIDSMTVSAPGRRIFVPPDKRKIGMVFQSYAIWPHMTVFGNVAFPLQNRRMPHADIKQRVAEVLELLGLNALSGRSATKLSGGQQQRVALGRALVSNPRLLLLDEPLSNLDAKLRESTRYELKRLQRQIGLTTIYVTHDQAEAMELSDRVLVLNHGRIEQAGAPRNIYEQPATPFVADFIGQANFVKGCFTEEAEPGCWRIKTVGGAVMTVAHPFGGAGQEVSVAIRPHRITLRAPGDELAGHNALPGRVVRCTYVGDRIDCLVDVQGCGEFRIETSPDQMYSAGEAVLVAFHPQFGRVILADKAVS